MAPEFEKSTRALRKFLKELEQQRIHFTEREWREGIDLWKSYSAHTSVGQILLEFTVANGYFQSPHPAQNTLQGGKIGSSALEDIHPMDTCLLDQHPSHG